MQAGAAFTPSLDTLDDLVRSLDLSAYQGSATEPWAAPAQPMPEQVVDDFLTRYLDAGGFWTGAYREDPALHPEYRQSLRSMGREWEAKGATLGQFDPLPMSANLGGPHNFAPVLTHITHSAVDGERATVLVERRSYAEGRFLPLIYTLRWVEEADTWQITGATTIMGTGQRPVTAAEEVVEQVFTLGLAKR